MYSNEASWVTTWEFGTGVVSTLPRFDGSLNAPSGIVEAGGTIREELDKDDFGGGFARWTGTSFAAAAFAARIAGALTAAATPNSLLDLHPTAAQQRVAAALQLTQLGSGTGGVV
jgi:serine protease